MLFRRAPHQLRCRNAVRGKDVLSVAVHIDRRGPAVALRVNDADPLLLTPLQVGWLRGELRAAVFDAVKQAAALAEHEEKRA